MIKLKNRVFLYSLVLMSAIGIGLAFYGIWKPYSYWWDELYSVTASELTFVDMFNEFIFRDVHPPLYQVVLSFWINLFGTAEAATRSLSLLFAISAIAIFASYLYKNIEKRLALIAIAFFATNNLFVYYSQETRSYAMMLFLSTIITLLSVEKINNVKNIKITYLLIPISVLLSTTHFFGLFYAGFILLFFLVFIKNIKEKVLIFSAGILSISYTVFHYFRADLGNKTGGNFWIVSDGIQTTISVYISAMLPQFNLAKKVVSFDQVAISVIALASLVALSIYTYKKVKSNQIYFYNDNSISNQNIFIFFTYVIVVFVLFIALVDLNTPISTNRNYIVLLPVTSLFLAYLFSSLPKKDIFYIFLLLLLLSSLAFSYMKIRSKQFPEQNNKSAIEFIEKNNLLENRSFYYRGSPSSTMPLVHNRMATFYFHHRDQLLATPIDENDISALDIKESFVFLSQHKKIDAEAIIERLDKAGFENIQYYRPKEKWESTIVIWSGDLNGSI